MNIGIIGSGNVGGTLGTRGAQAGHQVVCGSRNPGSHEIQQLIAKAGGYQGRPTRAASLADAVRSSEALLLATPWPAA